MLSLLMALAASTIIGQEPAPSVNGLQSPTAIVGAPAAPDRHAANGDAGQGTGSQPPAVARRRRGSMVGYIDDPIIASKLTFRFEAGFQNTVPDRAEFFYAKCGCYGGDAPGPRPGAAKDLDFQQIHISGEYAVSDRFSVFGHVPVRWIQPQDFILDSLKGPPMQTPFSDQSGFGDVRAGVRVGLIATDDSSLTVQSRFYFPTGKASKGLGTDHASFEPALLYYRRVSDVVVLESQVGMWFPLGGASAPEAADEDFSGNVFFYGIGPSFEIYRRGRVSFAPVVELVGWRVTSGLQTVEGPPPGLVVVPSPADGTDIVNLKVGARVNVDRGSFYFGYGHALTDATWYENIVRVEYRFSF